MPDQNDIKEMPIDDLRRTCLQEANSEAARGLLPSQDIQRACHELFRRAIRDGDQLAWEAVYEKYQSQVDIWVKGNLYYTPGMEDPEFFTNRVFEKMWAGLSPDKFDELPDLPSLLRYVQMCVHSSLTQNLRGRAKTAMLDEYVDPVTEREALSASAVPPIPVPAGSGIEDRANIPTQAENLWNLLQERLQDERERLFVYDSYVLALRPDQAVLRHPEIFKDRDELVLLRDHLLERLNRDREIRDFFDLDEVDANLEEQIAGTLYRVFCPESQELGELFLGLLPEERGEHIRAHLVDCPHCTREQEQLQAYLEALESTG